MVERGAKGDKGGRRRIREVKEAERMWGREKKITFEWGVGLQEHRGGTRVTTAGEKR